MLTTTLCHGGTAVHKLLSFIWQLPQNILGWFIVKVVNMSNWYKEESCYRVKYLSDCGISLGNYIIIDDDIFLSYRTYHHELGHQKQSKMLGPLYLLIIGIPSLIGNIIHRFIKFEYYKQPWEWWADRLGGVEREKA